jgi:hypothetical protein
MRPFMTTNDIAPAASMNSRLQMRSGPPPRCLRR